MCLGPAPEQLLIITIIKLVCLGNGVRMFDKNSGMSMMILAHSIFTKGAY